MYIPLAEDVRFQKWHKEPEKDYLVSRAVLYLVDQSTQPSETVNTSFGTRRSVSVHKSASEAIRRQALVFARDHLLDTFDVKAAAKSRNFGGNLEKLEPLELGELVTLEEAVRS